MTGLRNVINKLLIVTFQIEPGTGKVNFSTTSAAEQLNFHGVSNCFVPTDMRRLSIVAAATFSFESNLLLPQLLPTNLATAPVPPCKPSCNIEHLYTVYKYPLLFYIIVKTICHICKCILDNLTE